MRRKELIQRIIRTASSLKLPESDVAPLIDGWRRAKGMTFDKIQKVLWSYKNESEPWGPNDTQLIHITWSGIGCNTYISYDIKYFNSIYDIG
jgi:hypothetical protein